MPLVLIDLGGFGVELGGHQSQTFGACEIEAASGDAEAILGLATQELRGQHQSVVSFSSGGGSVQWF